MGWLKKTIIGAATIFFCALIVGYSYFVASTFKNFEFLLMCSQGKENLIPKSICQNYLFNFGGSPDAIADINRGSGVLWALSADDSADKIRLLEFLLEKGVDIDALDQRSGVGALHAMVIENDYEGVELLLSKGANPKIKEKNGGKTPLEVALERQGQPGQPDRTRVINRLKNLGKL